MSLFNPKFNFIDNNTLILFDEIQEYMQTFTFTLVMITVTMAIGKYKNK